MLATGPQLQAQSDSLRTLLLNVEDSRTIDRQRLAPLVSALRNPRPEIRLLAVRALGRFERPGLIGNVAGLLRDQRPEVRAEAINALGQIDKGSDGESKDLRGGARKSHARVVQILRARVGAERDVEVLGVLAMTLGRIDHNSLSETEQSESAILQVVEQTRARPDALVNAMRGIESLIRLRGQNGSDVRARSIAMLRRTVKSVTGTDERAAIIRRLAIGALASAGALDSAIVGSALGDADAQVRRLAILGIPKRGTFRAQAAFYRSGLRDPSATVRLEAVRGAASGNDCAFTAAVNDLSAAVAIEATDLLGSHCKDEAAAILGPFTRQLLDSTGAMSSGPYHRSQHALVVYATIAPQSAKSLLAQFASHRDWVTRTYAARAAMALGDAATLRLLANDPNDNVRDVAVDGLHRLTKHEDDSLFMAALARRDYQLVRTAAGLLEGTPERARAASALLRALQRISSEHRENSRDARVAILTRLNDVGTGALVDSLRPYLTDFDPKIAGMAAQLMTRWTGKPVVPKPRPQRVAPLSPAALDSLNGIDLMIRMARGGTIRIRLFPEEAPASVARVVRLARAGYYNGRTFHRVVANFVVQGGSPAANEYTGDGPFMRDEVGMRSHSRATVGISTRGRDTGDAQMFVNLVDNPRLDHDYTVIGEVVDGMNVVDGILEADVMEQVQAVARR